MTIFSDNLTSLIESASEKGVTFVYAISPGLDIAFSNAKDVQALKRKLEQVQIFHFCGKQTLRHVSIHTLAWAHMCPCIHTLVLAETHLHTSALTLAHDCHAL